MKIAIIGAGVSGLSCAHELERYSISPIIYEDLDFIGDRESHITANINVADRPIKEILSYYRNTCHLEIKPVNEIRKLTHFSPNSKSVITGKKKFGHFFLRGKESNSLKGQLYNQLSNTKIKFSQKPNYKSLAKKYDVVVVANGLPHIPRELNCWQELISGWIKGAVVKGDFDPNELFMWVNRKYCRNGYAYLCPYNRKKASLILFVPHVNEKELEYYWNKFLQIENIKYKILEEYSVEHFSGYVSPHKVDNIYFIGVAGGAISPFLGFGQVNSISMGVSAAQSIVEGLEFESLIKDVLDKEKAFYEMRKSFDKLTNKGFDRLINSLDLPVIKQLTYYSNIDVIKYISTGLKIMNWRDNDKIN